MRVTNRGKDYFIEQVAEGFAVERNGHIEKLMGAAGLVRPEGSERFRSQLGS